MSSIPELLRRVEITCKARYGAAHRLSAHNAHSQWALAGLTVGQIVISLISALSLHQNFSAQYVAFSSIFFAVLVLAYSLLLGMGNYASRGVKLHSCGLELGRLARDLYGLNQTGNAVKADYDAASKRYYDILEKHENHKKTDYLRAHYEYYSALQNKKGFSLQKSRIHSKVFFVLEFSHYYISLAVMFLWIYSLVKSCG